MQLAKKRVLIIGGTSGFGKQVAIQALQAGAQVHVIGRDRQRLNDLIKQLENEDMTLTGRVLDAQDAEQLHPFFASAQPFDHIVSMLGGAMGGGFMTSSIAVIRRTIEDKFFANLQLAQIAGRHLNRGGSLIFTSGAGGHPSDASGAIVGNQAINTLVAGLAVELAPHYRVNAVAPTWTPTGLWRHMPPEQLLDQEHRFAETVPLKRVAATAEVASAYLYLMSNAFVTGQVLHVDGGVDLA